MDSRSATDDDRIVIGSGPNGVAVAHALLARGCRVTMLDVSLRLESDIADVVREMARVEPHEWTREQKAVVQRMGFAGDRGHSPKRAFGSTFAYFDGDDLRLPEGVNLSGSHAYGGLSNVWGCALLRSTPADLDGWPVDVTQGVMACFSRAERIVTTSLGSDPFTQSPGAKRPPIAAAASYVLRRAKALQGPPGVEVYPSPIAIAAECKACNGCMYGCVYGYTYNTRKTIETELLQCPRFQYIPGVEISHYTETDDGVSVHAHDPRGGARRTFHGARLFIAAGLMNTLRLVWNSNPHVARTLTASDAASFLMPGMCLFPQLTSRHRHHGQSHLSVDVHAAPFDRYGAHCQIYFDNPAVAEGLMAKLPLLQHSCLRPVVGLANRQLVAAQGYLHSTHCHTLVLSRDDDGMIQATVRQNPETAGLVRTSLSLIAKHLRRTGLLLLPHFAQVTPFGGSKSAAALPHAHTSSPGHTDVLGRPFRSQHVFVVDATVLPAVPACNVTLTTMANAMRIGSCA